ncbi:M20/M25/M40 family metallo-hydrolase [Solimonas marina]|uniref:M20/M25/M40 family metallo-hydrolase n=1 Tax=Solimonas marina TaxID=2714601 RepID=A0A969WCX7_9GAMM|nr:M20/M25/M40 family metallo-hydrolase [Solimonas marina]NKF24657.1 M20/M25/M40 family metallo-hydrolase [Solimonas marina]
MNAPLTLRRLVLAALLAAASSSAWAADPVHDAAAATLPEYLDLLRLPNVTRASAADIQRNAAWVKAAFMRHGFTAQLLDDGDTPMVFAQLGDRHARKTVLFYAHMDGQPVTPSEWDQASPFTPVLKAKDASGAWQALPLDKLQGGAIDPEWRVFARSAADDKAPIMMLMAAADAFKAAGKAPAINIKVLIDSHEEGGKPTLPDVVQRNEKLLKADAVVMLDGPMHASNRPTLVFGHRGVTGFKLTVYGARGDMHSGHYGNYIPNPAFGLARLLTAFKDADGRVLIPGFYDGVHFDAQTLAAFAAVPDDEAALLRRAGVARHDRVGDNYQQSLNYPSLNVTAMAAADIEHPRTVIPFEASASFDIRTVPATPGARELALVRQFVEAQGYHLSDGAPTDAERAKYPLLASIAGGEGAAPLQTPLDAPIGVWATKALEGAYGEAPVRIPMMGGTVPTHGLVVGLKSPILLMPLVNADDNQHAANENLRLGNYFMGVKSLHALMAQPL